MRKEKYNCCDTDFCSFKMILFYSGSNLLILLCANKLLGLYVCSYLKVFYFPTLELFFCLQLVMNSRGTEVMWPMLEARKVLKPLFTIMSSSPSLSVHFCLYNAFQYLSIPSYLSSIPFSFCQMMCLSFSVTLSKRSITNSFQIIIIILVFLLSSVLP